jgi:amino acid adenylation domain-containing protein
VTLSFGQQRLWFLDRLDPGGAVYNIPFQLRLRGPLDVPCLRRALDTVVRRHAVLRARFPEHGGHPVQVIEPTVASVLTEHAAEDCEEWARRLSTRPFDLTHGPLLRADLLALGPGEHHLLITVHHIAFDAWSVGVLLGELTELYRALTAGDEPRLPELTAQYPDFVAWQQERLGGGLLERQLDYWRETLSGAPALLTLPTDRPRPRVQTFAGAGFPFTVPESLLADLRALAKGGRTTLFTVLLAAFQALLAMHSGQDDVVVGTPISARKDPRWEPLIGFFVNTIALRATFAGNPTFAELLATTRTGVFSALSNSDVPFEKLVEALAPQRSLGHSPVFQAQLVMNNALQAGSSFAGLETTGMPIDAFAAQVDLTLQAGYRNQPTELCLEYNTDLFDRSTIARLAEHYVAILAAVAADPDRPVLETPLLNGPARTRTLVDWNDSALPLPAVDCPSELVAGRPDAIAVRCKDDQLTYAGLAAESARLAETLAGLDIGPGGLVGLCLPRSVTLVSSILGIWRSGAGYVPLDPDWPADRLQQMITDAGFTAVVTAREITARLPGLFTGLTHVIDAHDLPAFMTGADDVARSREDLAYVIYTSGSTGRPKGVEIPRGAVINLLVGFADRLGLTEADVLAAVTTLSFDISVLELLVPLLVGGQVLVVTEDEVADGPALARRLAGAGATVMQATPAGWRLLLAAGPVPAGVRLRLCGGEAFGRDLSGALETDGAEMWNVYGPTETTVWSAAGRVRPGAGPVPLGPPIANTQLYVLNRGLEPVPVGVVGELHIGGLGLARGYHGRPELTRQRFVPDPFGPPGSRLYVTGDLARYRADGSIEFLGRRDHQVKVRGFRIELGEIEAALVTDAEVREAVVTTWAGGDGDARLVAYVTPSTVDSQRLRAALARRLPDYMLPATFVAMDAFPLTPNGKTDRAALPEPDWAAAGRAGLVPPDGPVQTVLAGLWRELLRIPEVGATDDFFRFGGHSLLGAELLARIRGWFGVELPVRTLFESPTVAGLAEVLTASDPEPGRVLAIAELRCQVDALSADEVDALLAQS